MRKAAALRAFLADKLDIDPATLQLYITKGTIACGRGGSLSFEYRYPVTIELLPWTGPIDAVTVPLLVWIAAHQPSILDDSEERFTFEAEPLDNDQTDITVTLQLTEFIRVDPRDGGGFTTTPIPEPAFIDTFDGVPTPATLLRRLYLEDAPPPVKAAETRDADWLAAHPE